MNPLLARTLIFLALVVTAMLIIIGVASVSHAAECLPDAPSVWAAHNGKHATWNMVGDAKCWRVGYGQHHHSHLAQLVEQRRKATTRGSNPGVASKVRWQHPWHAELYEEFQDWMYLGKR
jgi:hypothetical protein